MKALQKGFTLIELMIVVAIVGILAAIALQAYQDYMVRAKISEPLAKLDELKLSIAEFVASNNITPANASSAGIGSAGGWTLVNGPKYYKSVGYQEVTVGTVVMVGLQLRGNVGVVVDGLPAALDNVELVLQGAVNVNDGTIAWTCGTTAPATSVKLLPSNCRNALDIAPE